ncbi:hypothetical protein N7495_004090 [Penicillium taxi]|uniref:uncharacterized protein n=1 Tax=Penicillium taxi TaxID=168475 RepID=UPI0025459BA0|nr:uncharacterized protein N7495_004090 [Penicillium taxi]KAJ5899346.1 hypothetical protein N7495_004090 [Penicillium taxi]
MDAIHNFGLAARRIHVNSNATCDMPTHLYEDATEPFVGKLSFYHFNMILSGSCTAVTFVAVFALMSLHANRLSNPNEQLKIMRICTMLPLYSIFSFLSICFPNAYVYLNGWIEVFQGVALYSFLMLLCDFLAPNDQSRIYFFSSLQISERSKKSETTNGLTWLRKTWYKVIQYPIIAFIIAIIECITQSRGVYCLGGHSVKFAHIWLNIIQLISVFLAISSILRFYKNTKSYMQEQKPLTKLLAFKLIVGLVFLEKIIFTALETKNVLSTSSTMTYADLHIGLPTMIICIQMVPFAFFFHYAYGTGHYIITGSSAPFQMSQQYIAVDSNVESGEDHQRRYQGGPLGIYAWIALINPVNFFSEIKSAQALLRGGDSMSMDNAR